MQSRPSFRPMPTPTTPGRLIRRSSCFRLTALTVAIVSASNASAGYSRREPRIPNLSNESRRFGYAISWRGRPDEPFLHEELRLFAGPPNHLERSLVQRVACLRLPSDSLLHRLKGDRGRLPREHINLVHRRHDVRLVEALLLRDFREFLRGRDAHLVSDRARADVQSAAENPGEPETVVDLVREVGPSGRDHTGPGLGGLPRPDLRHRVRDDEQDGIVGHRRDPVLLDDPGAGSR